MRVLGISSSPRRDGNSSLLTQAALEGAQKAGHSVELVHVADCVGSFLLDCRRCRSPEGRCTIDDRFGDVFVSSYLPADAIVFGTPLYWYGMSGQLKTFLDRMFCYYADSAPDSATVVAGMSNKRLALVYSSEETYVGASLGLLHQVQEFARYTHSALVGVVRAIANSRGEVADDPADPLGAATALGSRLLDCETTDYRLDTVRPESIWRATTAPPSS